MKVLFRVLAVLDALLFILMIVIRIWWNKTHSAPGFAEMLNIQSVDITMIITGAILFFIIAGMVIIKIRK